MLFDGGWEDSALASKPLQQSKKRKRTSSAPSAIDTERLMNKIDKQLQQHPDAKRLKSTSQVDVQPIRGTKAPSEISETKAEKTVKSRKGTKPASREIGNAAPGLTALQSSMKSKLDGARFRWINEVLYKSDSADAVDMLQKDPKIFEEYHAGFRRQVESWPSNPVDIYVSELSSQASPSLVIADLGCGEAALARSLVPRGFTVISFDLVSNSPWVIAADVCSKVPLPGSDDDDAANNSQVVDVCICALSLMNINWLSCVREARRVLKVDGILKIAEVTSRFQDENKFVTVVETVGFKLVTKEHPSTHFTLFEFRKIVKSALSEKSWKKLLLQQSILQPCEYKRR